MAGTRSQPCLSWRSPGGFWSLHEDGEGERLRISNHSRGVDLEPLSDEDLEILQTLIAAALAHRKIKQS